MVIFVSSPNGYMQSGAVLSNLFDEVHDLA